MEFCRFVSFCQQANLMKENPPNSKRRRRRDTETVGNWCRQKIILKLCNKCFNSRIDCTTMTEIIFESSPKKGKGREGGIDIFLYEKKSMFLINKTTTTKNSCTRICKFQGTDRNTNLHLRYLFEKYAASSAFSDHSYIKGKHYYLYSFHDHANKWKIY